MGLSMCSQATISGRSNVHEFQFQKADSLQASEEWEVSDDDSDYFNLGRMGKSMIIPETRGSKKFAPMRRVKSEQVVRSRGWSSQEKMKNWHRSSVVNQEAELQAKRYSEMVMDDTLKHLSRTIHTASSMVEKGASINNELARQDRVLANAETDISIAEYETDQVTETLKGMRSLRGKLKSVIWKKEPKPRLTEFDSRRNTFSNVNLDLLNEDVGLFAFSKMDSKAPSLLKETSEDKQQIQFKAGMGQLHKALDIMAVQQKEAAWALESQEGRLSTFEDQLATTNDKIKCQSQMINTIMGKS